jgi:membrane-bound serine protease (ClpP class)
MARLVLYALIGVNIAFALFILSRIVGTIRSRPVSVELYGLRGKVGLATEDIPKGRVGYVKIQGEYWRARAAEDVARGSLVMVIGIENGLLIVTKAGG